MNIFEEVKKGDEVWNRITGKSEKVISVSDNLFNTNKNYYYKSGVAKDSPKDNLPTVVWRLYGIPSMSLAKDVEGKSSIRMRPKGEAVFYNPAADITNILPQILYSLFTNCGDNYDDPMCEFADEIRSVLEQCIHEDKDWVNGSCMSSSRVTSKFTNNSNYANKFFYDYFLATLDYFRHSIRSFPEDVPKIPDMIKAIKECTFIRTMPDKMKEEYIAHREAYNNLSAILSGDPYYDVKCDHVCITKGKSRTCSKCSAVLNDK